MVLSWLWWSSEGREAGDQLHEKRDQVLAFLENELDLPATASKVVSSGTRCVHAQNQCMHVCMYMYVCMCMYACICLSMQRASPRRDAPTLRVGRRRCWSR